MHIVIIIMRWFVLLLPYFVIHRVVKMTLCRISSLFVCKQQLISAWPFVSTSMRKMCTYTHNILWNRSGTELKTVFRFDFIPIVKRDIRMHGFEPQQLKWLEWEKCHEFKLRIAQNEKQIQCFGDSYRSYNTTVGTCIAFASSHSLLHKDKLVGASVVKDRIFGLGIASQFHRDPTVSPSDNGANLGLVGSLRDENSSILPQIGR